MAEAVNIVVFGAHPDDAEYLTGGVTTLWSRLGYKVLWVSLTNGDAGHIDTAGAHLARRRRQEARAAAEAVGAESLVLDHHDGTLMPTLELRFEVIRIIREFKADLVITHRPNDYHPDHRYAGVVVQDAINMVIVGNLVPYAPALDYIPVMMYMWDHFQKPYPFIPDVVVDVDAVEEQKLDALHCHTSQMYEFIFGKADHIPPAERREWLRKKVEPDLVPIANLYRQQLIERYGQARGEKVKYAEAFEVCEYGWPLTEEKRQLFFPF